MTLLRFKLAQSIWNWKLCVAKHPMYVPWIIQEKKKKQKNISRLRELLCVQLTQFLVTSAVWDPYVLKHENMPRGMFFLSKVGWTSCNQPHTIIFLSSIVQKSHYFLALLIPWGGSQFLPPVHYARIWWMDSMLFQLDELYFLGDPFCLALLNLVLYAQIKISRVHAVSHPSFISIWSISIIGLQSFCMLFFNLFRWLL